VNTKAMIPELTSVDMGSGIVAVFTARFGGVSQPPWEYLNLGPNVQDDPQSVAVNRRIISDILGFPIAFASQVHGNNVLQLSDADSARWHRADIPITAGEADGLATGVTQLGLGVLVADCVPVLLASDSAVAVAHAGRRGIELGAIGEAIKALHALGGREIRAAIGPAICGNCYEVPLEMQNETCATNPAARSTTRWGTPGLNLPAAAVAQLEAAGVAVVYRSPVCTFEDDRYYSHRRATKEGTTTGRQAGIIARVS